LTVLTAAVAAGLCGAVAVGLLLGPRLGAIAAGLLALLDAALVAALVAAALVRRRATSPMSQRFERGFDDAAIGMMMLTQKLHVIRANDTLSAMLGRRADELIGHSILEFTHPDDVKRSIDKREKMRRGDDHGELVKRYVRPDGTTLDAVITTALVEPGDAEPYFFSQLQDVTERYRAQRQKALIADLGRRALESADAVMLMGEAVRMVREVLGTANCIVTRRLTSGTVRLVAADGETVGPTLPAALPSQTGHTLLGNDPVLQRSRP
jgi:PAS domain S-box-containing protein